MRWTRISVIGQLIRMNWAFGWLGLICLQLVKGQRGAWAKISSIRRDTTPSKSPPPESLQKSESHRTCRHRLSVLEPLQEEVEGVKSKLWTTFAATSTKAIFHSTPSARASLASPTPLS